MSASPWGRRVREWLEVTAEGSTLLAKPADIANLALWTAADWLREARKGMVPVSPSTYLMTERARQAMLKAAFDVGREYERRPDPGRPPRPRRHLHAI